MKRFLLLLSLVQFAWVLTYCGNQNAAQPTSPTTPTTSDTICFEADLLPLLRFNCAQSGCHDVAKGAGGVVTEDYATIKAQVTPNNLDQSALYNVVKKGSHQGISLDPQQVELIQNWILQGAQNTTGCGGTAFKCDTAKFTYNDEVRIILDKECVGCHNANTTNLEVRLDTYEEVKKVAASGALLGAIEWQNGFTPMPRNRAQLPECERTVIKKWIEAGMPF